VTLVDTTVLLDVVRDDAVWADWSQRQLEAAPVRGPVLMNELVFADLAVGFRRVGGGVSDGGDAARGVVPGGEGVSAFSRPGAGRGAGCCRISSSGRMRRWRGWPC